MFLLPFYYYNEPFPRLISGSFFFSPETWPTSLWEALLQWVLGSAVLCTMVEGVSEWQTNNYFMCGENYFMCGENCFNSCCSVRVFWGLSIFYLSSNIYLITAEQTRTINCPKSLDLWKQHTSCKIPWVGILPKLMLCFIFHMSEKGE